MNRPATCPKCGSWLLQEDAEGDYHCHGCGKQIMVSRVLDIPQDMQNKRVFSGHSKTKLRGENA